MSEQLTDLIAAALYAAIAKAAPSGSVTVEDMTASLLPVVHQHTNGRITELEAELAEVTDKWGLISHHYRKAEAAIARVREIRCGVCNNPLSEGSGNCVSEGGRPHVYDEADLRAALEGEQP